MPYIGNSVQNQGFAPAIDYFNGNGVTVTFTLSRPLASVAQIICAIDNVIQNPSSAFTVSGNSITFTSAPLSGTNNIWVEYTSLITTYQGISQDPSVIGDITATGGYLSTGDFGNSFIDGTLIDYVTGAGRFTVGELDDLIFYHGGTGARSEMMRMSYAGNSYIVGNLGVGTTNTPSERITIDATGNEFIRFDKATVFQGLVGVTQNAAQGSANSLVGDAILRSQNGRVLIDTAGGTRAIFNASGMGLNGAVPSSGVGITFPATQSASTDPNTLDDYEEGEWTARLTSDTPPSSVPQTQGNYTKVGNLVTVFVRFTNVNTSGGSGNMFITGLPFTSAATPEQQSAIPMMYGLNVSGAYITAYIGQSQTRIDFIGVSNNAAWVGVNMTAGSAKYFNMSITYRAA
jgi:hypothetical protein